MDISVLSAVFTNTVIQPWKALPFFFYDKNREAAWNSFRMLASSFPREYSVIRVSLWEKVPDFLQKRVLFRLERAKCYPEVLKSKRLYGALENKLWILVQHRKHQILSGRFTCVGLCVWFARENFWNETCIWMLWKAPSAKRALACAWFSFFLKAS